VDIKGNISGFNVNLFPTDVSPNVFSWRICLLDDPSLTGRVADVMGHLGKPMFLRAAVVIIHRLYMQFRAGKFRSGDA